MSAMGQKRTYAVQKDMFASPLKADVAFRALTTDFSRVGRPLLRHPDWFAAIGASLLLRRHSWRRYVGDPITDNTQSAVDYVVQSIALDEFDARRWCIL